MRLLDTLRVTACRAAIFSCHRRLGGWVLVVIACGFGSAQALDDYAAACSSGCHGGPPPNSHLNIVEQGGDAADSDALKKLIDDKNAAYTGQTPPLPPPMPAGLTSRTDVDWEGILAYLREVRNGRLGSSSYNFGNRRMNSSSSVDVLVTNRRSEDVTLDIQNVPTGFTQALVPAGANCVTGVTANSSCTLRITFQPSAEQSYGGTLQIKLVGTQVSSPVPLDFAVSGAGIAPHLVVASSIGLNSKVNESASATLLLRNTGQAPLAVASIIPIASDEPATSRPALFTVVAAAPADNPCASLPPVVIPAASQCTVGIAYTRPLTPPARPTRSTAVLRITSDSGLGAGGSVTKDVAAAWGGTSIPLPGVALSIDPARSIDFSPPGTDGLSTGEVLVGDSVAQSFTIRNGGAAASRLKIGRVTLANTAEGDFAVSEDCTTPPSRELVAGGPGNLCTVTLTFAPKAPPARRNASITIASTFPEVEENDPTATSLAVPVDVALSGYGYLPLSLGPPPPLLRHAVRGVYRPTHIVLANTGVQPLQVNELRLAGAGFTMTDNCPRAPAALPPPPDPGPSTNPATQCAIDVSFDPAAVGSYAATLTVVTNAPGSPHQLVISGEGTASTPPVLEWQGAAGVVDQGTVMPGQTSDPPRVLRLYNRGPGRVEVSLLNAIGERAGEFGLTPSTAAGACPAYVSGQPTLPLLIYDNEFCDILATFSPTAPGLRQATVQVVSSGTNPAALALQGTGAAVPAAPLEASTTLLMFSGVQQGSHSVPQSLVLRNNTATTLRVMRIVVGDGFEVTGGGCAAVPFDLAAGAVCTMSVQFVPADTGTMTTSLSVYTDGRAEPLQVQLEGAAVAKPDASGGGCSLSDGRSPFDPVLWLSVLAALGVLWRRGRHRLPRRRPD